MKQMLSYRGRLVFGYVGAAARPCSVHASVVKGEVVLARVYLYICCFMLSAEGTVVCPCGVQARQCLRMMPTTCSSRSHFGFVCAGMLVSTLHGGNRFAGLRGVVFSDGVAAFLVQHSSIVSLCGHEKARRLERPL
jgi:hypothetical protein